MHNVLLKYIVNNRSGLENFKFSGASFLWLTLSYRFVPTILPLKMEVNYEKKKNLENLVIFLLCSDYDHYIRAIWEIQVHMLVVNRSISSDSSKIATVAPNGDWSYVKI